VFTSTETPLIASQMPRMQMIAKQNPQNTTNPICSPAYLLTSSSMEEHTQKINFASVLCHELPPKDENMIFSSESNLHHSECLTIRSYHPSGKIAIRCSSGGNDIKYSFHIILRKRGPVESMTVRYGSLQFLAYLSSRFMTRR
jgi:hypothetical protein